MTVFQSTALIRSTGQVIGRTGPRVVAGARRPVGPGWSPSFGNVASPSFFRRVHQYWLNFLYVSIMTVFQSTALIRSTGQVIGRTGPRVVAGARRPVGPGWSPSFGNGRFAFLLHGWRSSGALTVAGPPSCSLVAKRNRDPGRQVLVAPTVHSRLAAFLWRCRFAFFLQGRRSSGASIRCAHHKCVSIDCSDVMNGADPWWTGRRRRRSTAESTPRLSLLVAFLRRCRFAFLLLGRRSSGALTIAGPLTCSSWPSPPPPHPTPPLWPCH